MIKPYRVGSGTSKPFCWPSGLLQHRLLPQLESHPFRNPELCSGWWGLLPRLRPWLEIHQNPRLAQASTQLQREATADHEERDRYQVVAFRMRNQNA